jgi:hypothetical protein
VVKPFPRLRLSQELGELSQGGRRFAAFPANGRHRHDVPPVLKRHRRHSTERLVGLKPVAVLEVATLEEARK